MTKQQALFLGACSLFVRDSRNALSFDAEQAAIRATTIWNVVERRVEELLKQEAK
jgi:hypothetical protein